MPKGRPFPKGVSGNPGGLPHAIRDVMAAARTHTHEAIATLVEVMRDGDAPHAARATAAVAILDRGWGRPSQAVDLNVGGEANRLEGASSEDLGAALRVLMSIARGERQAAPALDVTPRPAEAKEAAPGEGSGLSSSTENP